MTIKDAIMQQLSNGFSASDVATSEILVTLIITIVISLYLFAVYRFVTANAFYSLNFNISMVAMSVITAGIIMAMQSSIVISLGMVGALSIVRFRTAIKEPLDLLFLFWSIGTGIICGAGLYKIAIITAVCVTVIIVLLRMIPASATKKILFVSMKNADVEADIDRIIKEKSKRYTVKSRNITAISAEYVYEISSSCESDLVNAISKIEGVNKVSLIANEGEFRG